MNSVIKEVLLIKKRFFEDFMKSLTGMLYHIVIVGLSAAFALSLPLVVRFVAKKFLIYWSLIGNDKIFLISVEMMLTIFFLLFSTYFRKSWKDRKLSNMARAAGIIFVTPAKGFFALRKIRKLKEKQGLARDIMVISSTGFRTFVDPKGELHQVIQNCREAKIMLLNPNREGATVRAKSIPDPDVTPESFGEQIRKSVDFLKSLKAAQKNVKLKLYSDPPFLKMTILGDYIWLQYYQTGLDVQMTPKYVFKHDSNTGSLYLPFYQYFMGRWNNPDIPEYDLETDEFIYRDMAGNEVRRERFSEMKVVEATNTDPTNLLVPGKDKEVENRVSPPPLWTHQDLVFTTNFFNAGRRDLLCGLHPGSKEFFLLRSKNPICETAGWITIF